jgi:hypothetical protein
LRDSRAVFFRRDRGAVNDRNSGHRSLQNSWIWMIYGKSRQGCRRYKRAD